jgi:Fe-S-cluster containining protein
VILNRSVESVHLSPAQAAGHTLLPLENRFACLPECGLCCSYRVLVTEMDRRRLEVSEGDPIPWEAVAGGELALPRGSEAGAGFCFCLDRHQRCTVHQARPEHCRVYPYLWTTYDGMELDVDLSCPGLGQGEAIPKEWRQAPVEPPEQRAQRERAVHAIESMLRAQQRYASPKMLAALGAHFLDELASVWATGVRHNARTLGVEVAQPHFANMENERELDTLRHGIRLVPRSASELMEDAAWLERHLVRPQWGTRLSSGGAVKLYRFWADGDLLYTEARGGPRRETLLAAASQLPWKSDALATRRAYLRRWLGRQILVRLASNLAMAAPMPGSHVATEYLKFLFEIDQRLALLAPALARTCGKEAVDRPSALEAIRGSDALLRAWCESARVGAIA